MISILEEVKMKVQCKICRGKGKIPQPKFSQRPMLICGMYGEQCLDLECNVCCGTGWFDVSKKGRNKYG
jgi:hypothetical protein